MTHKLVIVLRGEMVTIEDVEIAPADRSVGIMSDYVESFSLWDYNGKELTDWYDDLTDEETQQIEDVIFDARNFECDDF